MSFFNHVWGKKITPATYAPPAPQPAAPAAPWSIGPTINGVNWSPGMDGALVSDGPDAWHFDFPVAQKGLDRWSTPGPHYVTKPVQGLAGSALRLDFELQGNGDLFGVMGNQDAVPYICLHFQRAGDDWSAKPPYDGFRWYTNTQTPLVPGRQTVEVPLAPEHWHPVENGPGPAEFAAALASASCVGVTFGNTEGNGHGVAAASPSNRFICHSFALV